MDTLPSFGSGVSRSVANDRPHHCLTDVPQTIDDHARRLRLPGEGLGRGYEDVGRVMSLGGLATIGDLWANGAGGLSGGMSRSPLS